MFTTFEIHHHTLQLYELLSITKLVDQVNKVVPLSSISTKADILHKLQSCYFARVVNVIFIFPNLETSPV